MQCLTLLSIPLSVSLFFLITSSAVFILFYKASIPSSMIALISLVFINSFFSKLKRLCSSSYIIFTSSSLSPSVFILKLNKSWKFSIFDKSIPKFCVRMKFLFAVSIVSPLDSPICILFLGSSF